MEKLKKILFSVPALFIYMCVVVWAAQQTIVSTDTLNQAWTKQNANNTEVYSHTSSTLNPHTVTATQLSLGNTDSPAFNALTLTGANTLSLGTSSLNNGSLFFKNSADTNYAEIKSIATTTTYSWILPPLASSGSNYFINVDADGTMGYVDPATISTLAGNEVVTGNRTYTGAIDSTGASSNASGPLVFTSTVTPPAADGKITYLSGVTGWTHKIFSFFTTTVQYILSYDTLPTVDGSVPTYNATNDDIDWTPNVDAIEFVIDGGGSAITTGVKGYIEIPYECTINSVTMLADQSGSAVVDIWVDTYANYPPLDADSITASAVPTITTALKSLDATLTGWTTSLTKGSVIGFNVDSATTITFLTISLKVDK